MTNIRWSKWPVIAKSWLREERTRSANQMISSENCNSSACYPRNKIQTSAVCMGARRRFLQDWNFRRVSRRNVASSTGGWQTKIEGGIRLAGALIVSQPAIDCGSAVPSHSPSFCVLYCAVLWVCSLGASPPKEHPAFRCGGVRRRWWTQGLC